MLDALVFERMKTQVLASRGERIERQIAAFERQPAVLKTVDLYRRRIISPIGLPLASIGLVLPLVNRKRYSSAVLVELERVTRRRIQTVINHVLDAQTLRNRVRKTDCNTTVVNAKLYLARPVVCISAHRFKKRRRYAFLVFDGRTLSDNHTYGPSPFHAYLNRIIRRKTFAYGLEPDANGFRLICVRKLDTNFTFIRLFTKRIVFSSGNASVIQKSPELM